MMNSYDVAHGLSQVHPGPEEPVEIAQQDDTLARTGNTARDQEMYAAGLAVGEENAKHNAAIRAGVPEGWKLLAKKTCYVLMHDGAVIATLAGPESEANAAIIARMLAAPGVSTVEDAGAQKEAVMDAIADALGNAYDCMRVWSAWSVGTMSEDDFRLVADDAGRLGELADAAIAAMSPAPAAGDALDAARWRFVRRKLCLTGNGDGTCAMQAINLPASIPGWPEPGSAVAEFCDAAIDAALAAQRKGNA